MKCEAKPNSWEFKGKPPTPHPGNKALLRDYLIGVPYYGLISLGVALGGLPLDFHDKRLRLNFSTFLVHHAIELQSLFSSFNPSHLALLSISKHQCNTSSTINQYMWQKNQKNKQILRCQKKRKKIRRSNLNSYTTKTPPKKHMLLKSSISPGNPTFGTSQQDLQCQ